MNYIPAKGADLVALSENLIAVSTAHKTEWNGEEGAVARDLQRDHSVGSGGMIPIGYELLGYKSLYIKR
jgi:hypothetical protein